MITKAIIDNAISYAQYRDLISTLLLEGKTTGSNHSEEYIGYTKLNMHRMQRIEKQATVIPELAEELNKTREKEIWLVLTEAWCGDAAQLLPGMQLIAQASSDITLKILLRDENPDVMDLFLTKGSRSIPKLICLDAGTLEVKWSWGPRPSQAQALMAGLKKDDRFSPEERAAKLHGWYAKDKTNSLQQEILRLVGEEALAG